MFSLLYVINLSVCQAPQSFPTRQTFSTELQGLQQDLHHPNILALYSVFFESDVHIQVMEYTPTGDLAEYVGSNPLPQSIVLRLLRGLASALVYLCDHQIVHRAIHPTHILLDTDRAPVRSTLSDDDRFFSDFAEVIALR